MDPLNTTLTELPPNDGEKLNHTVLINKRAREEGFTLIEVMTVAGVLSVLAALALPALFNQTTRSKASEALINIEAISRKLTIYYDKNGTLPGPAARAPDLVSPGAKNKIGAVAQEFLDDPGWSAIDHVPFMDFYFSYQIATTCGEGTGKPVCGEDDTATVTAYGDLNGNGITSQYTRVLTVQDGTLFSGKIFILDELE
jgi:prepilin-type N-terminal cleavage/methylation domain-containing protein